MIDLALGGDAMTAFIVIGAVGLAIVIITLLLGEIFDGIFGAFDVDVGGGIFSAPVIGSFLAAFGFGAALIMFAGGVGATAGALGGLASGLVVGGFALAIMRSLMNMPTDATVTTRGLEGVRGTVITPIPAHGYGEVTIRHHGEQRKYNAQAQEDLPIGTPVEVTGVLSASAVTVIRADTRGSSSAPPGQDADGGSSPTPSPPPSDPSEDLSGGPQPPSTGTSPDPPSDPRSEG